MRSEGFPFIVGVWGWTCVRVVLLSRRRLVVVSSLIRCHWAVHSHCDTILTFKVWKVEEVSHEMLVLALPSHKMWGHFRVLRDRRNTLEATECKRVVFAWQAQHFVMWPFAMSWQAQHFVTWRRCCFHESQWQGRANVTLLQISWQAQDLVIVLKSGGSFAKSYFLSSVKMALSEKLARNLRFSSWKCEIWRKSRTKCSFWRFKLSRWEVIFAFCVAGARLWKLLLSKVAEVSHEMLVLEASALKSCGSLARNARFGSFCFEKLRKPRTKCSFCTLVAWKVGEVSHEMFVLEACCWKSCGSLARNARFGSLLLEKLRKPRTKCSFWKLL